MHKELVAQLHSYILNTPTGTVPASEAVALLIELEKIMNSNSSAQDLVNNAKEIVSKDNFEERFSKDS